MKDKRAGTKNIILTSTLKLDQQEMTGKRELVDVVTLWLPLQD
jgi:hypothetical protein